MQQLIPAFAGIPTIYWSNPGMCKTSSIEYVAEQLGYHCETIVLSQCDPADIGGIPTIHNGETIYAKPDWLARLEKSEKSILFFDELTTARPSVQAPALTLIQSRKIHNFELPKNTIIIAASNPPEVAADGSDLEPPMANRFCHMDWKMDLEEWTKKLLSNFKTNGFFELPENWKQNIQEQRGYVASFLNARPSLANNMPQERTNQGKAWPSFRTWTNVATVSAAAQSVGVDDVEFICGCVGAGAGLEYINWRNALDLPDPESILKNPSKFKVPNRDDVSMAIISSVIAAIQKNKTKDRWHSGWDVLARIGKKGKPDIATANAGILRDLDPEKEYGMPKDWSLVKKFIGDVIDG